MFLSLALSLSPLQGLHAAPIPGPVRRAGTYHVATGTWSPGSDAEESLSPKVLYDNSATSGLWASTGAPSDVAWTDEGRIPSTSGHANAQSNAYRVDGFSIGYCSGVLGWNWGGPGQEGSITFYESYAACTDPGAVAELRTIPFVLPGAGGSGTLACWIVDFDLQGSGDEFTIRGDADGVFDGTSATDGFGWSLALEGEWMGELNGPILAGDPNNFPYGDGTYYQNSGASSGTGLGTVDSFWLSDGDGPVVDGCQWLGGYSNGQPFSSFYLELHGDAVTAQEVDRGVVSIRTLLPYGYPVDGIQEYAMLPELSMSSSAQGITNPSTDILARLDDGPWNILDSVPIDNFMVDGLCENDVGGCAYARNCGDAYISDTDRVVEWFCSVPTNPGCACGTVFADEKAYLVGPVMGPGQILEVAVEASDDADVDPNPSNDVVAIRIPGQNYCTPTLNSTGLPARIGVVGSASLAASDFTLIAGPIPQAGGSSMGHLGNGASGGPARSVAAFVVGDQQTNVPFGNGVLCVQFDRILLAPVVDGEIRKDLNLAAQPFGQWFQPGTSWHFQALFHDPQAAGVNASDGYTVTWQP